MIKTFKQYQQNIEERFISDYYFDINKETVIVTHEQFNGYTFDIKTYCKKKAYNKDTREFILR